MQPPLNLRTCPVDILPLRCDSRHATGATKRATSEGPRAERSRQTRSIPEGMALLAFRTTLKANVPGSDQFDIRLGGEL